MATGGLLATAVAWLCVLTVSVDASKMPHVSTCNFCMKCHVGDEPPKTSMRKLLGREAAAHVAEQLSLTSASHAAAAVSTSTRQRQPASRSLLDTADAKILNPGMFLATQGDTVPKQVLGNCTECYGCNTQLSPMQSEVKAFNITYINEKGASSSWLFRATTNKMPSGQAVVKVYCMPIPKHDGQACTLTCSPVTVQRHMQLQQALEQLSEECGFTDILPEVWIDRVDAVMPDLGYHIRWHGLWMELIQGVSMERLLHSGIPHRLPPQTVLDLLHNKLNKTQVVRAAIFDLLTSQCDRHSQNIFIDENGQLKLIDNEQCLDSSWKNCGVDSIFIPTTQKQEILRLGNEFVMKYETPGMPRKDAADPQLLLDYRCYLGEGREELGTDYPPQVTQCLRNIAAKTVKEVQTHYKLEEELPARNLHARATDMLTKGFEWSYKFGEPRNAPPRRYLVQPKCCSIEWTEGGYRCAHKWKPVWEVPKGDPVNGREWTTPRPDTGTFEGGERYIP